MNRLLKRVGLILICVSMLSIMLVANPVWGYPVDQRGPRVDTVRWKVTRSPAAQLVEMTLGPPDGSDTWMGMIRPTDVEAMDAQGKTLSSRSMMHFCEFGFNYRSVPLDDVNFRHAIAHLVPKEMIIGTLFKYIDIPVSTPVAPAQGLWYNPYVDPHPYSRAEAETILGAAGYKKPAGTWLMPDNSPIPNVRVYIPLEIVAPTSYTIGRMVVDECHAIGLTSVNLEPMDFSTYTSLAFNDWDFDIFWVCWRLGTVPTLLYAFFHSSQNFKTSRNCYGINYPDLDAEIETFYFGLDHPLKVAAAKKAQELIMGGTTTAPLGYNIQPTDPESQAIPLIPVYSRNAYDTQQPDLRGSVNMFGYGFENGWTWMNIYWNTPNEYRPGTTERMVVPILDEFPETLNPTSADTVYAADCMEDSWDALIATNPYTHRDVPWLATSWSYGPEPGGLYITFNLRMTDNHGQPIKWQDGDPIAASDVKFAWDFLADNMIGDYWATMMHYISSEVVGNQITAHMDTTSQWYLYSLAGSAYQYPPQVWQVWDGQPTADIESWDPSAVPGPGGLPTSVYGTGPFILQHSTTFVNTAGYCDVVANRDYWLTTAEIEDIIAGMFHSSGDVNYDNKIDIPGDLYRIGAAWHTEQGQPGWDPDADICGELGGPPDLKINIDDLSTAGKFFGETKTVP